MARAFLLFPLLLAVIATVWGHGLPRMAKRSFCGNLLESCVLFPGFFFLSFFDFFLLLQFESICSNSFLYVYLEVTEGPYYYEDLWVRQDMTEDRDGIPLRLVITVQNVNTCEFAASAAVDLW